MPTTAASRAPLRVGYQPDRPALVDRALDRTVRDCLRQLRAACPGTLDAAASQAFSDAARGRAVGTLALSRMLDGARRSGAPLASALQVVRAVEGHVRSLWLEPEGECPRTALQRETATQGTADLAQLQSVLTMSPADLERAIEATAVQITASQQLLASLTREVGRRRA